MAPGHTSSALAEKEQHVALERQRAAGLGKEPHLGIWVSRVPAGEAGVVVQLVVCVPPQHHVAESESLLECGEKLRTVDPLAAQDAVVVEHADLDVCKVPLLNDCPACVAVCTSSGSIFSGYRVLLEA